MTTVDTNVLIYYHDTSEPRRRQVAFDLITSLSDTVLLWQVAVEFVANARKYSAGNWGLAWQRLDAFRASFPLVTPTPDVLPRARELIASHQLQYWDALIYAACLEARITRLYSEDTPGSAIPGLEIVNPFIA